MIDYSSRSDYQGLNIWFGIPVDFDIAGYSFRPVCVTRTKIYCFGPLMNLSNVVLPSDDRLACILLMWREFLMVEAKELACKDTKTYDDERNMLASNSPL
jgi:hypothetical protein